VVIDLVQQIAELSDLTLLIQHLADALTQPFGCCTQVRFKNLTDVHPRRNTQGVENHVNCVAMFIIRHVLNRHDR